MLDKKTSERLNLLRFPLIVGVVFIHAYGSVVHYTNAEGGVNSVGFFSMYLQEFISHGIARVAVPTFFLISGFLFYTDFNFTQKSYIIKLKSRFNTLLIPFVLWNILIMLFLFLAQSFPYTQGYFSGENQMISTYGLYDFVNNLIGLNKSPIAYQFWFIRDLIFMILFVPFLNIILKMPVLSKALLVIVLCFWFIDYWPVYIPSATSFLFFFLGSFIAKNKIEIFILDRFGRYLVLGYLLLLIVDCFTKQQAFNIYIHNLGILLGVAAIFYITHLLWKRPRVKDVLIGLSGYSFFVFAFHEPLLTILKKITYKVLEPSSDIVISLIYLSLPTLVIIISIGAYKALMCNFPKTMKVISGGR